MWRTGPKHTPCLLAAPPALLLSCVQVWTVSSGRKFRSTGTVSRALCWARSPVFFRNNCVGQTFLRGYAYSGLLTILPASCSTRSIVTSKQPANCLYPEQVSSSQHHYTLFKIHFNSAILSPLRFIKRHCTHVSFCMHYSHMQTLTIISVKRYMNIVARPRVSSLCV
jgi:hypothetical protein